jgi:hypothetical protein
MNQRLFYDDEFAAQRVMVEEGKGYKATAIYLWPHMKPESAYARLKNATRGDRDEKLSQGEVIAAMNFNERFDPLYHAADQTHHERPKPVAPMDEARELQSRAERLLGELKNITERQERLTRSPLQNVNHKAA